MCRREIVPTLAMSAIARELSEMSPHDAALTLCDRAEELDRSSGDRLRPSVCAIGRRRRV